MTLRYSIAGDAAEDVPAPPVRRPHGAAARRPRILPPEHLRPSWSKDPDRALRILAALLDGDLSLGDLGRAVRLPGEPVKLAKLRTIRRVRELYNARQIAWSDHRYTLTGAGLAALRDGAADGPAETEAAA